MKKDGKGQASVFQGNDFVKLMGGCSIKYALIFRIAYYTAARIGEVVQLPVQCVYTQAGIPLPEITFWAETTKDQETRAVPVSNNLRFYLEHYWTMKKPNWEDFYLFPGRNLMKDEECEEGKCDGSFLQFQSVDDALRRAIEKTNLQDRGYSCHSFRRSAITRMSSEGISLKVIQEISGHEDLKNVQRYIDVTQFEKVGAIGVL
jgi:integrase/recombinase XerD